MKRMNLKDKQKLVYKRLKAFLSKIILLKFIKWTFEMDF